MDGSALCLLLLVVQSVSSSEQDLFRMIDDEGKLVGILRKSIEIEDTRLKKLKEYRDKLMQHAKIYANEDELAWNPLAIFKTIKHLTVDLEDIKANMMRKGDRDLRKKLEDDISYEENILREEIRDLVRLQRLYNVSVIDMMEGRLAPNLTIAPGLRAEDCILIGETLYKEYDLRTAVNWLQGCKDKFGNDAGTRVLETILSSALILGDKPLSRKALAACFETDRSNRLLFATTLVILSKDLDTWQDDVDRTEQLKGFLACGRSDDEQVHLNLKCRYVHHNSPFLILAPLKEEVLSSVPKISLFREAVYESEIERMEIDAHNINGFRIAVFQFRNGSSGYDLSYRPAERAPLYTKDYLPLQNRLEDISSLSLKDQEIFQMIKYTPGGFFRVHGDLLPFDYKAVKTQGNRLGTIIMYLNNVDSGGNTVFPYLKLSVTPVKGSVLFWMNIKADGSKEPFVTHAACPVIYGEKIICTQFFRTVDFCPHGGRF